MSINNQIRGILAHTQSYSSDDTWTIQQYSHVTQPVKLLGPEHPQNWKKAGTILVIIGTHLTVLWFAQHMPVPKMEVAEPKPVVMEIVQPEPLQQVQETQPVETPSIFEEPTPNEPPPVQPPPIQQQTKPVESKPVPQQQENTVHVPEPVPAPVPEPLAKVPDAPIVPAKGYAGYLSNPAPEYPDVALERGWEGEVILRVKVSPEGQALQVDVQQSSGKKLLDDTAVKTVKRWRFSPAKQGNQAIEGWVEVPIGFELPN